MQESCHPLLIKGRYRVVAMNEDPGRIDEKILVYAVLNTEGAKLRLEYTLEEAKAWMEMLFEEDRLDIPTPAMPTRPKAIRR